MNPRRVRLGRDAILVAEDAEGVELEGAARLVPGALVDLVDDARRVRRPALVWSWQIARLGSTRPLYRGYCRWA